MLYFNGLRAANIKFPIIKIWTLYQHPPKSSARSAQGLLFGTILNRYWKVYDY